MAQNHDYDAIDFDNDVVEQTLQQISDNWIALLTCHSGSTPPSGVNQGAYWLDTSNTPYELKQLNSSDSWVSVLELTSLGRDILNDLLTEQGTMDDLWTTEHNRDGTHKNPISGDIDQFKSVTWTTVNVTAVDEYIIEGDQTSTLLPDGDKGRMVRVQQPSGTVISPVENATYDGGADETTVTLHSNRTADLDDTETIDDHEFGVVGPSESQGLPLLNVEKMLLGDGTESDSALRLGAFSLPFDDTSVNYSAPDTQTAIEKAGSIGGYLEPGGLTIANNSTDSEHDIDVVGGQVAVHDFNDNWQLVNAPDETPAIAIDSTGEGGRINSSTLDTNAWYEIAVLYDSTNDTVGYGVYKDADRPTSASDLPGDYDHLRAMGSPGKTWWIQTDGSSNIRSFDHNNDGDILWSESTLANFSDLLNTTSVNNNSNNTIDVSSQLPPTKSKLKIGNVKAVEGAGSAGSLAVSRESLSNSRNGEEVIMVEPNGLSGDEITLSNISNQQLNWRSDGITEIVIKFITKFKAVN